MKEENNHMIISLKQDLQKLKYLKMRERFYLIPQNEEKQNTNFNQLMTR